MAATTAQLVGYWEKTTVSDCSQIYPDRIEFRNNGLYFAHNNPNNPMIIWDVGKYRIESSVQIRITLVNDASELYRFSIANNILTLIDSKDCEFEYHKVD